MCKHVSKHYSSPERFSQQRSLNVQAASLEPVVEGGTNVCLGHGAAHEGEYAYGTTGDGLM